MENCKYKIEISKTKDELNGTLTTATNETIAFSPLNIVGDLFYSIFDGNLMSSIIKHDQNKLINNVTNNSHIYEIAFGFEENFDLKSNDLDGAFQYYKLLTTLNLFFNFPNSITLDKLNEIREYFELSLLWQTDYKDEKPNKLSEEEKGKKYPQTPHSWFFTCYSKADVLFSILKYLVLNNYQFKQCLHCQKYFATQNPNQKYCHRKSPMMDYEEFECEKAVKKFLKDMRKNRAVYLNLYNKGGGHSNVLQSFGNVCNVVRPSSKSKTNVESLMLYEAFLNNEEIRKHYYSKSKEEKQKS